MAPKRLSLPLSLFLLLSLSSSTLALPPSSCTILTEPTTLRIGVISPKVQDLQRLLNQDPSTQVSTTGAGSPGKETMKYGVGTYRAVKRFQEKYKEDILTPNNLSRGTGALGPSTKKKLLSLYCREQPTPVPPPTPTPPPQPTPTPDPTPVPAPNPSPINGSCGSSNSQSFTTPPTTNLCSSGTASSVTTNSSTYTWSCTGSNGGTTASCSATKTITPSPSGSLSLASTTCIIATGSSVCTIPVSWSISNPVSPSIRQGTTQFSTSPTGSSIPRSLSYGTTTFTLLDGSTTLDSKTATASCVAGTGWDGGKCGGASSPITGFLNWNDTFDITTHVNSSTNLFRINEAYSLDVIKTPTLYSSRSGTTFSQEVISNGTTYTADFPKNKGTIELWVNGAFTNVGEKTIFDNWDGSRNHVYIRTYSRDTNKNNNIQIAFQKNSSSYLFATSFHVDDSTWNHIAITWDMATAKASVYLNGALVSSGAISDSSWRPDAQKFIFGSGFSGQIKFVRVLSEVLTQAEIHSDLGGKVYAEGQIISSEISPTFITNWKQVGFDVKNTPNAKFSLAVEYDNGYGWSLVPDSILPGNSEGFTSSPISVESIPATTYKKIRLKGTLQSKDQLATPELYSWQVTWGSASNHPRLHLDLAKISFLKSRINSNVEPYKSKWVLVQAQADKFISETPPVYPTDPLFKDVNVEGKIRYYGNKLPFIAMAYLITGDIKYVNGAKKWMDAFVSYPVWGEVNTDLGAAHLLYGMAIAYDWLYPNLSSSDRAKYEKTMGEHLKIYKDYIEKGKDNWWVTSYSQNHNMVNYAAITAASVAGYESVENAEQYIDLAYDNFTKVLSHLRNDGTSEEGESYWTYGLESMLRYSEVEKSITGIDRSLSSPHFQKGATYRLYSSLPNYWETIPIADSVGYDYYGSSYIPWRLASLFKDPVSQWLGRTIDEKRIAGGQKPDSDWRSLLWYDDTVSENNSHSLPTQKLFDDLGLYSSRSLWSDDSAIFFAFKAGPPFGHSWTEGGGSGHVHPDSGGFILNGFGKNLIIDDGYPYLKSTSNHNVATFDNVGQLGEGSTWFSGTGGPSDIIYNDINPTLGYEYLIADISKSYTPSIGVTKYLRHYIFLKKKTLVIIDEIELSASHQIQWRLHLNYNSDFSMSGKTLSGKLTGASSTVGLVVDDVSNEPFTYSITKEAISSSEPEASFTFYTNTFLAKKTGNSAKVETVIRPYSGTMPGPLEYKKSDGALVIKLDDGTYTSISTDLRQVKMNVPPITP